MASKDQQGKEEFHYEFGGPIGGGVSVVILPVLVMFLSRWSQVGFVELQWNNIPEILLPTQDFMLLFQCGLGLLAYFLVFVLLWAVLPGPVVQGAPVLGNDKLRLPYKLNGHATFWVVVIGVLVSRFPLNEYLFAYYDCLAWMANLWTFLLSVYFYVGSFQPNKILAEGGNSGSLPYDFWMGRELNPRIQVPFCSLELDWKQFCELRPGLIGWVLLNYACLQQQRQVQGYVSGSMWLLNGFQAFYVWDSLYQERAILTTMDITTDGFGFMLCFGDMAWVPFTYTVNAKYLVNHDPHLSLPMLTLVVVIYLLGFYMFRGANGQKDVFRRNPNDPAVAHLTYLQTKRGTRLLTSGWWGMARKINYTGDYIMGLTYCLLCGFDSIVPYYYAVYFAVLLIHRSTRDDEMCQAKYGADWDEYKKRVPYRFIPGIV
eukprot:Nitzschia sp. Nitz4//scaffold72_size95085//84588//85877//NITZ4_004772-RA/size95085-processed-gene-0.16-mRNA-1//1//CDS//3329557411//9184//frame0